MAQLDADELYDFAGYGKGDWYICTMRHCAASVPTRQAAVAEWVRRYKHRWQALQKAQGIVTRLKRDLAAYRKAIDEDRMAGHLRWDDVLGMWYMPDEADQPDAND